MNYFRKVVRHLEHLGRIRRFIYTDPVLDPQRVVNRSLYGTDYHPDEVCLNNYNDRMSRFSEAMIYSKEFISEADKQLAKTMEEYLKLL